MGPIRSGLTAMLLGTIPLPAPAQAPADSALARYIATIPAIDNHAHPMRPVPHGAPADSEYDALPLDGIPPFPIPWRLTLNAPVWTRAARALYGRGDSVAADRKRVVQGVEAQGVTVRGT